MASLFEGHQQTLNMGGKGRESFGRKGQGANILTSEEFDSVFDPVAVPHSLHKYSKRLPVGRTSSKRSRVGVACRHVGQNKREARNELNCSSWEGDVLRGEEGIPGLIPGP